MKEIPKTLDRIFSLEPVRSAEGYVATYRASLSSEMPIERFFGTEILSHEPSAVNMERAGRGLSLLFNHDIDEPIGRVSEIKVENKRLVGQLQFSPNSERGPRIQADVEAGFLGDVSIRYSVDNYETRTDEHGHDTITITRWTPMEASIVTVPADHTVGVGRSKESTEMTIKTTATGGEEDDGGNVNVVKFQEAHQRGLAEGERKAGARERTRITEIDELFASCRFKGSAYDALRAECVQNASTLDQARAALFGLVNSDPTAEPVEPATTRKAEDESNRMKARDPFVQSGATADEKMVTGITRSIEFRAGLLSKEDQAKETANEFKGLSLVEMARICATRQGLRVRGLTPYQMLGVVLKNGGQRDIGLGTEDFTGILANVSNKSLLRGWETAMTTYRTWCRIGSLSDFKRANRTALSGMELLDSIPENGEYKYGKAADRTEYITAVKYGKLFSISREAIINDDLNAFTQVPQNQGRAADLTINKAVYDSLCLTSGIGPTLNQDSTALFHTNHNNYTATAGTPAVTTLETGRNLMARQTDPTNSMPLNIRPKYLLVPSALSSTANILVASEKDPLGLASATGGATAPNPFYNQLTVVTEAYLDDLGHTNGTVAWYLLADQNVTDTYEVGFLNGQSTPYLESKNGWDVDVVEYKVRIEAGVAALDYRGMYRKKGA